MLAVQTKRMAMGTDRYMVKLGAHGAPRVVGDSGRRLFVVFRARNHSTTVGKDDCQESRDARAE
jgi:hypothetical protein